jgi:hypothetical protein
MHHARGMRGRWEEEPTELMPSRELARLIELSRNPSPFVVTVRTQRKPAEDESLHRDDFSDEEPPSILIPITELEPVADARLAPVTYASIPTVLVTCVITFGCALVVTMLML